MQRTRRCGGSPKVWRTSSSGMPPALRRERRKAWRRTPGSGHAARHHRKAWRSCGPSPGVSRVTWRPAMPRWPTPRRHSAISRAPRCCAASRPRPPGCFRREPSGAGGPRRDAGGDRRLRPAARRPRRPGRRLRHVPARGRGPGGGGGDAGRTTVGGERPAAERPDPWPADRTGQGGAPLSKPGGDLQRRRPVRGQSLIPKVPQRTGWSM